MIKVNTSTNTFRMTIALMKQIWGFGKPGPTLYCCGGEIFLSFGGKIIQVAMVVAILNTYTVNFRVSIQHQKVVLKN